MSLGGKGDGESESGSKGECESESGSDGVDVLFSCVAGFAGLLPVVSGVLASNSLIINEVSFSGIVAILLVVLGLSSLGCCGWFWRNAFLSPSKKVSGFAGMLLVFSCVLGVSTSGCCGWFWRNAFLSPSKKVSGFADSLPYPSLKAMATDRLVSGVLGSNSLIINEVSFSSIGLIFSTMEA